MELEEKRVIKVGYGRVSTIDKQDKSLENQQEMLKKYGCDYIFFEKSSGRNDNRVEFKKSIKKAKELAKVEDVKVEYIVVKNDRLSRKFLTSILTVNDLIDNNISYISLSESIDTSTIMGKMTFNLMASFAEFEVEQTRQRVKMGLEKAKRDGKTLGRPRNKTLEKEVLEMYKNNSNTISFIAESKGISEKTVYNIAKRNNMSRK